jgi:hypothetical protein
MQNRSQHRVKMVNTEDEIEPKQFMGIKVLFLRKCIWRGSEVSKDIIHGTMLHKIFIIIIKITAKNYIYNMEINQLIMYF